MLEKKLDILIAININLSKAFTYLRNILRNNIFKVEVI